jgi:hypothetical protein
MCVRIAAVPVRAAECVVLIPFLQHYFVEWSDISITECDSGRIQKLPILSSKTETASHKNDIWRDMYQLTSVPVLSDVAVTFFSSVTVLNPNGNFWILPLTFSGRY